MMNLDLTMKMTQVIQIYDKDADQNYFLIEKDGEWVKITEDEYNQHMRGK